MVTRRRFLTAGCAAAAATALAPLAASARTVETGLPPLTTSANLGSLTASAFRLHLHTTFRIYRQAEEAVEVELIEVQASQDTAPSAPSGLPVQFSLVFRGPAASPLPQKTYRLEHPRMGILDLFLVPIARKADTVYYEAILGRFT